MNEARDTLHLPARLAAVGSACALGWHPFRALLSKVLGGRSVEQELTALLLIGIPYLLLAALPWPPPAAGKRWIGLLFVGAAYVTPTLALAVLGMSISDVWLALAVALMGQVVLLVAGIEILRQQRSTPSEPRFSALFWALVLAALSPAALIFALSSL